MAWSKECCVLRVLVVTDKYPPHAVGGAEISLHLTLTRMRRLKADVRVAVLDQPLGAPEDETFEGVAVTRLQGMKDWPPTYREPVGKGPLGRRLAWPTAAVRYAASSGPTSFPERLARIDLFRTLSKQGMGGWFPTLEDDLVANSDAPAQLSDLVAAHDVDLVHADNYRSILICAAADLRGRPFSAMVRDNRFFCAHRDQKANIAGTICTDCAFGCVAEAEPPQADKIAQLLASVRDYRLSALRRAARITTTSAYLERQLGALAPGSPISVIGNPADDPKEVASLQADIARAAPPEILIVGMLNDNKGQARVVEWIKALKADLKDFRFVLAGRGRLGDRLAEEAREAGVADHLVLPGYLDRSALYRAYARASLVIAPNVWPEPFGRAPLEAGLSQRPVIAYEVGGIGEAIVDRKTGHLIAPGDEEGLLAAIKQRLGDRDGSVKMGAAARSRTRRLYGAAGVAKRLHAAWRDTIPEG